MAEKIPSDSADYKALIEFHHSGGSQGIVPKVFYESEAGAAFAAKYTFKALQYALARWST